MTVFVHLITIISFKFLFVDRLGPTATLNNVAPMTFMMTQQRTRKICNPKLIRNLRARGKTLKCQSDCKDAKFYHFIG